MRFSTRAPLHFCPVCLRRIQNNILERIVLFDRVLPLRIHLRWIGWRYTLYFVEFESQVLKDQLQNKALEVQSKLATVQRTHQLEYRGTVEMKKGVAAVNRATPFPTSEAF